MKLSKLAHEGDLLILRDSNNQDIFVVKVDIVRESSIKTYDIYPNRSSSRDNLTDDYGWQLLAKASSLSELQALYPQYFI